MSETTKVEHTPGPWELKDPDDYSYEILAVVNIGEEEGGGVLQPIYDVRVRGTMPDPPNRWANRAKECGSTREAR